MKSENTQQIWQQTVLGYASDVNTFVEKGIRDGWENAGVEPQAPDLEALVGEAIEAVRKANHERSFARLRELWPPAHGPLISVLEENGQSIPIVYILPDQSIVVRIGSPYENGKTIHIKRDSVNELPHSGIFGRSPNRRYFAIADVGYVSVVDGWGGPEVARLDYPTGLEGVPEGFDCAPTESPLLVSSLFPFPDGQRVLLMSSTGIFVLASDGATRLFPTTSVMREHFEWQSAEYPGAEHHYELAMEHGAISSDGKWIAVGCQDSTHLVFDAELNLAADVGTRSEYPHYSSFSSDDKMIAFNSCHFYNGVTIGVPTTLLPGLKTEPYGEDDRVPTLQDFSRVYAGVSRGDEFIIGDADGYVRAFSDKGDYRWQLFIGSTIGSIDISDDGKTLVVSSYAGFISIIHLDSGEQAPHQIGNSKHLEARRWLFWKNEKEPLIW